MSQYKTKSLVGQPDQLPTPRDLHDSLAALYASGRFSYFATFRAPEKAPPSKGDPQYDPEADTKLAESIARQLARDEGISSVVTPAFRSVAAENAPCRHFHAALSKRPSAAWIEAKKGKHGPRAVDVRELGSSPKDPQRVAWYHAKQSTSVTIASPRPNGPPLVRSAPLDDAGELFEDFEDDGSPGPEQPDEETDPKDEKSTSGRSQPPQWMPPAARRLPPIPLPEPGTITREEAIALTLAWFARWEATLPRPPPTRP